MRDLLLLMIFTGLIPFVVVRPWVGVLVWSWIGYMNPHRLAWGFTTTLPVAMVFGGLTIAMMFLKNDKKGIPLTGETITLFLLCILFTITTYTAWVQPDAWMQWDKVMKILLFTFVTMMLIYGRDRIHALFVVIAVSIGFYGVKGGIFTLRTGGHYRIVGPPDTFIGGNTTLGLAMLMVLPLIVMLARQAQHKWLRRAGYASTFLMIIAIGFTYSRGALVGLVVVLPLMFLKARKKTFLLMLIIPVALAAPYLVPDKLIHRESTITTYQQDMSAMERIQAWGVAWNVALSHPLTGAGFKLERAPNFEWLRYAFFQGPGYNMARAAHSIYFQMLGEHGFPGLILFLVLLVFTFRSLYVVKKAAKSNEQHAWLGEYATAIQIGLVGYAVSGAFLSLAYFDLFYAFVALAVIMRRELALQPARAHHAREQIRPALLGQQTGR